MTLNSEHSWFEKCYYFVEEKVWLAFRKIKGKTTVQRSSSVAILRLKKLT
jgi:hypothetical protein